MNHWSDNGRAGLKLGLLSLLALGLFASASLSVRAQPYDPFGGWTELKGRRTGFFHAEQLKGRWWLVSPDGNAFFSKGVCNMTFEGDLSPKRGFSPYEKACRVKYGSEGPWAQATAERLKTWNFNTVGAWSSPAMFKTRLPFTVILDFSESADPDIWQKGGFPDVFSEAFRIAVDRVARDTCQKMKNDPWLLGYFTDNELHWGPDWRSRESLLDTFLKMPKGSPGRARALAFSGRTRGLWALWSDQDQREFLGLVAGEYFRQCQEAIRRYDPNHMILGCRFASYPPTEVLGAMRDYVEVASCNDYSSSPPVDRVRSIARITGRPVIITEFSFRGADSGLPNTVGGGEIVPTQAERAERFSRYVRELANLRDCVGYHWFQYSDQPADGRFDGQNNNYGLVKEDDSPWGRLTSTVTDVNRKIDEIAARAADQ